MRKKIVTSSFCSLLLVTFIFLGGCSWSSRQSNAGLVPVSNQTLDKWRTENVRSVGNGNFYQVVGGRWLGADTALQASAGDKGHVEYFCDIQAGREAILAFRLQFLSTQGTARLKIIALDEQQNCIGSIGWIYSGQVPVNNGSEVWIDARYGNNYSGNWIEGTYHIETVFRQFLPAGKWQTARNYRCSVEIGEGQHVLITGLTGAIDWNKALVLTARANAQSVLVGDVFTVETTVRNEADHVVPAVVVSALEPYGYGLVLMEPAQKVVENLQPGEVRRLTWQVKAQRPDAVNLNQPWSLQFAMNDMPSASVINIAVMDPRPGRIFYVMTEDLEPIDSAGYGKQWGNADGWLNPQELQVQMVNKAEKLNKIAEQYGAKWTHYIAWPVIKAAEWAALQQGGAGWQAAAEAVKQSVSRQSAKGHEYALHLHMDYDPLLPGNILAYNPTVNGLWANHLRHGWAHALGEKGDFNNYASRTGTLYTYQKILDSLAVNSQQGQIVTARAGSFDFGSGSQSEAMSILAYRSIGLWGSSDADGNEGGLTSAPFGKEIYFTAEDDINQPAIKLSSVGLVEFRPTPRRYLSYDNQSMEVMNAIVDQGITAHSQGQAVKPGIHAIVGFTHAMFVMGDGDWTSTDGGQYKVIEDHLAYVKKAYADQGVVQFATAGDLVKAYLAYYSPQLVSVYGPRIYQGPFFSEFAIVFLGDDIPVDSMHAHTVKITYPLYLRESAYRIKILKNGEPIVSTWGLPTEDNTVNFVVDDRQAKYTLRVYDNRLISKMVHVYRSVKNNLLKYVG
ncbi:MAG: hypothetical protein H6Q65_508 [Firmicutes bacterium]|nr:hypothetical protein [Bacillota bacterium]